jgi:hypothetical protein
MLFAMTGLCGGGALLSLQLACPVDSRRRLWSVVRLLVAIVGIGSGVFACIAAALDQPFPLWASAGTVAALYIVLVVVPSPRFLGAVIKMSGAASAVACSHRGRRAAILALWIFCPFFALGLLHYYYERPDDDADAEFFRAMAELVVPVPIPLHDSPVTTDRGRTVAIDYVPGVRKNAQHEASRLIGRQELENALIELPHAENSNCHGFVFTGGRYSVDNSQVEMILGDNGYSPVSAVSAGDLAVYRDDVCKVIHTGIVRGLASGGVILVESKFGQSSRFVHPHDRHAYPGADCIFYRSARAGHLLRGVYPTTANEPATHPSAELPAPPAPPPGVMGL